ncbi:MAG: FHA domain-containing protein [Thioalkalispiraceae bacterium]|jgi:pSer/pThr/pTyr-binding forkhead associated (FHA) protein
MAKLILTHEGAVIKEFNLDKERTTVGRKPSNDIQLDDPTVSGQHAVFLNLQNIYIEDLNSTNGTLLNGKKVNKRQLEHGDVVRIGHHEMKFINENAQDFESTVIIQAEPVSDTTQAPAGKPILKVINGPRSGATIELNKAYTTLGQPGGQVAVIARRGTNYFLMQMGGTGQASHPKLNDVEMSAESMQLKKGDVIEVAGTRVEFTAA